MGSAIRTQNTYAKNAIDPAVTYYSTDNDVSIRLESRKYWDPEEVYLELHNQKNGQGWKLGMNDDYNLHVGWGRVGTANGSPDAIRMDPGGTVHFYGDVGFKAAVTAEYSTSSGLECVGGSPVHGSRNRWTGWSSCPASHSVVGLQEVHLDSVTASGRRRWKGRYQEVDHYQCRNHGCRAWCWGRGCTVVARCCRTTETVLTCHDGQYKTQRRNRWGSPSYCAGGYTATGFSNLDLHNNVYHSRQMVNDFFCDGGRYCRAWCWGSNCGVRSRCCKPRNRTLKIECQAGTKAYGDKDRWGPFSKCPVGFTTVTARRINMLDRVHLNRENMAKQQCNDA